MRYKIGDRVKVKTWSKMVSEYGLQEMFYLEDHSGLINFPDGSTYGPGHEYELNKSFPDRVLLIDNIGKHEDTGKQHYCMKDMYYCWSDYMIEGADEVYNPILSRFEILDL